MNYHITVQPQVLKIIPPFLSYSSKDNFYAFDMDGTLIQTKGKSRFAVNADDWKWFKPKKTQPYHHENMFSLIVSILKKDPRSKVVIFSNQGGIRPMNFGVNASFSPTRFDKFDCKAHLDKNLLVFIEKVMNILKFFYDELAEERVLFYCSFKSPMPKNETERKLYANQKNSSLDKIIKNKDAQAKEQNGPKFLHDIQDCRTTYKNHEVFINQFDSLNEMKLNYILDFPNFRKPNTGMLEEFHRDIDQEDAILYYVGDAAGRRGDFSDSDMEFANNGDLEFYTPEELFSKYPTK